MPSEHNDNRSRWIKTLLLSLAITIALNSIGAGFAKYIPYAETVALAAFFCLLALIALNPLMAKLYMKSSMMKNGRPAAAHKGCAAKRRKRS